ncbi:MAG: TlpA disulfide reductase family protein, partial [Acidobacteriota bacterium]
PSLLVVGDLAPHLALPIYPDSDKGFDLTEATEDQSLVVVTFWASWCLPCRVELHRLTELFDQYGEAGLEVVAVNLDSERQEVQRFLDESPLPFPVVLGNDSDVVARFGVRVLPTTVLVDSENRLVRFFEGFSSSLPTHIERHVRRPEEHD